MLEEKHTGIVEVCKSKAGFHVRLKAMNGKIVFTTEVYKTHKSAEGAIDALYTILQRPKLIEVQT